MMARKERETQSQFFFCFLLGRHSIWPRPGCGRLEHFTLGWLCITNWWDPSVDKTTSRCQRKTILNWSGNKWFPQEKTNFLWSFSELVDGSAEQHVRKKTEENFRKTPPFSFGKGKKKSTTTIRTAWGRKIRGKSRCLSLSLAPCCWFFYWRE